jgi:GTP-binding protein
VVDGAARDAEWDYDIIRGELAAHDPKLLEKPMLVVFNKTDLTAAAETWPVIRRARGAEGVALVEVAAATGAGVPALRTELGRLLPSAEELAVPPEPTGVVVHRLESAPDAFQISRDVDGAWRVAGPRIERLAAQTNFMIEESAERFQRTLERMGIDADLRRAGVEPGDAVRIGAVELEWAPELWSTAR